VNLVFSAAEVTSNPVDMHHQSIEKPGASSWNSLKPENFPTRCNCEMSASQPDGFL